MTDYADLQASLNRTFKEPLEELIARNNPWLNQIRKVGMATDRIWLKSRLTSNHNAGPIPANWNATDGFSPEPTSTLGGGVLDWAIYKGEVQIPKLDIARLRGQPGVLGEILGDEIRQAALDVYDAIARDMMLGTVTNGLVGAQTFMTAGTYAGIDSTVAGNEEWAGIEVDASPDGGTTPGELSTTLFDQGDTAYFNRNKMMFFGSRPSQGIYVPSILHQKYKGLFTTIDYSALASAHFVNQANATNNLNLGRTNVGWTGVPLIADFNVAAAPGDIAGTQRMYALNWDEVVMAVLDSDADPIVRQKQQERGVAAGLPRNDLGMTIEVLGNTGEQLQIYVKCYIQLVAAAPKRAGIVFKNISTAA